LATITTGVFQFASADGAQLSADVDFTNSGDLIMTVFASATGPDTVTASANIDFGIRQSATDADDVSVTLTNTVDGTIGLNITAYAKGDNVSALANNTTHVFEQHATAGDDDLSATALLVNDGMIYVNIDATAYGTDGSLGVGDSADASAFLSYAFSLSADDGAITTQTLTNNGSIIFDVNMLASHASDVFASVDFDTAFWVYAGGNGGADDIATVNFTNNGLISIHLDAVASGVTSADATVDMAYFVTGSANGASVATFNFTNTSLGVIDLGQLHVLDAVGLGRDAARFARVGACGLQEQVFVLEPRLFGKFHVPAKHEGA